MPDYEAAIGMEVHAELLTASKMFCACRNAFGGEPNSRCCPVCLGMPGALPVANRRAIELATMAALALNCTINPVAHFDRKNYFYPDLPKSYQISQYDCPIGVAGWLDIETAEGSRRVHIRRVHLEEDTGKLMHLPSGDSAVDFNRSGVPLLEIVTEFPPDMRTAAEAKAYLVALRAILTYIGVSDGRMEEGSLRCEPNVSVRPVGASQFGTKTEIKNLNSFRAVERGIAYEIERQIEVIRSGGTLRQETRGWNEDRQETVVQRTKEEEQEYRYFPDPDLVPVVLSGPWLDAVRASMPELPEQARRRFVSQYGLSDKEAAWLTQTPAVAAFFDDAVRHHNAPSRIAAWIMGDFARLLNATDTEISGSKVTAAALAELVRLVDVGRISGKMAKTIFERMFETGETAERIAEQMGSQISDPEAIAAMVNEVRAAEPEVWEAMRNGDTRKLTYMMGQVMKLSRGKANPQQTRRIIEAMLAGTDGNP